MFFVFHQRKKLIDRDLPKMEIHFPSRIPAIGCIKHHGFYLFPYKKSWYVQHLQFLTFSFDTMGKHRPLSGDSFLHEMNTRRTFGNSAGFTDLGNIPLLSLIQFHFIFWVAWIQLDMSSRVVNQICACILSLSELNSQGISHTPQNCHWLLLQITLRSHSNTSISIYTEISHFLLQQTWQTW